MKELEAGFNTPDVVKDDYQATFVEPWKISRELSRKTHQFDLTKGLLKDRNFQPTTALHIGDRDFLVGKIIQGEGPRVCTVMYTQEQETERWFPRILYKSLSDGGWRSCPGVEDGYYIKGNDIHYTQETKPHPSLVRYLTASERDRYVARQNGDVINDFFDIDKKKYDIGENGWPEWYTFHEECRRYNDGGALREFQKFPPGRYSRESFASVDFTQTFRDFDFSTDALAGFLPDFNNSPLRQGHVQHSLLGLTTTETYGAALQGRPVEWTMAYDKSGRVWIDRIAFSDTPINSYGVPSEVIDSGALTNKPIEYDHLVSQLKETDEYRFFSSGFNKPYMDITPLLNNLRPIRDFRAVRGIEYRV